MLANGLIIDDDDEEQLVGLTFDDETLTGRTVVFICGRDADVDFRALCRVGLLSISVISSVLLLELLELKY